MLMLTDTAYHLVNISDLTNMQLLSPTNLQLNQPVLLFFWKDNSNWVIRGITTGNILTATNLTNNANISFTVTSISSLGEINEVQINKNKKYLAVIFDTGFSIFSMDTQSELLTKNQQMDNVAVQITNENELLV